MAYSFTEKKRIRKSFAKRHSLLPVPFLLAMQLDSHAGFLQASVSPESRKTEGLQAAFKGIFPIESHSKSARLEFVSYTLGDDIEILQLEGSANMTGTGSALENVIFSNNGVDTLVGGGGNDIYYVHNAADQVLESAGEGTDTVYTDKSYTLADNV